MSRHPAPPDVDPAAIGRADQTRASLRTAFLVEPGDESFQSNAPPPEQAQGDPHVMPELTVLGHPLRPTMRGTDLRVLLGYGHSQFATRQRRGDFRFLELDQQLPGPVRYSGHKVARWLRGERVSGAPGRARAFFQAARRHGSERKRLSTRAASPSVGLRRRA